MQVMDIMECSSEFLIQLVFIVRKYQQKNINERFEQKFTQTCARQKFLA